jgi:hypothetical protein
MPAGKAVAVVSRRFQIGIRPLPRRRMALGRVYFKYPEHQRAVSPDVPQSAGLVRACSRLFAARFPQNPVAANNREQPRREIFTPAPAGTSSRRIGKAKTRSDQAGSLEPRVHRGLRPRRRTKPAGGIGGVGAGTLRVHSPSWSPATDAWGSFSGALMGSPLLGPALNGRECT